VEARVDFEEQQVYRAVITQKNNKPYQAYRLTIPKYFVDLLELKNGDTILIRYEKEPSPHLILEKDPQSSRWKNLIASEKGVTRSDSYRGRPPRT